MTEMLVSVAWEGVAATLTGRRSWLFGLGVFLLASGFMVLIGGNAAADKAPLSVPTDSDSAKVETLSAKFPGGDRVPLILVVSRADGADGSDTDPVALRHATEVVRDRMLAIAQPDTPGRARSPLG